MSSRGAVFTELLKDFEAHIALYLSNEEYYKANVKDTRHRFGIICNMALIYMNEITQSRNAGIIVTGANEARTNVMTNFITTINSAQPVAAAGNDNGSVNSYGSPFSTNIRENMHEPNFGRSPSGLSDITFPMSRQSSGEFSFGLLSRTSSAGSGYNTPPPSSPILNAYGFSPRTSEFFQHVADDLMRYN